jgi:hypothetical protein
MYNKPGRCRDLSASCKRLNRPSIILRLATENTPRLAADNRGSTNCHWASKGLDARKYSHEWRKEWPAVERMYLSYSAVRLQSKGVVRERRLKLINKKSVRRTNVPNSCQRGWSPLLRKEYKVKDSRGGSKRMTGPNRKEDGSRKR